MEARDRKLVDWFGKISRGEIKLPRFQRYEAWDSRRICSLMNVITHDLPLGITLVLEVGEKEQFISRYLSTAPETNQRVFEQLLDGQQRLTAIWRVLHNNYEDDSYFIYIPEFDDYGEKEFDGQVVYCRSRYYKKNHQRYPLWCDDPEDCLKRGMIPTDLLKPIDLQTEIEKWINEATKNKKPDNHEKYEEYFNWKKIISDKILELRNTVKNYNLPFLSLPSTIKKDTALEVFINMNTNSKPLSQYDIIVAEIESIKGRSLHDLQDELDKKYPDIKNYYDLSYLILNTSALLQEKLPNQRGAWEMDKSVMVDNWAKMEEGLQQMASFLLNEGIIDSDRLPTNAVLAVIAALYPFIPPKGDKRGADEILLKKYLWSAFFTDRYENSAASRSYADYIALKRIITAAKKDNSDSFTEADVQIFNRQLFPVSDADELLSAIWPKRDQIRGKAILTVACRLGSYDFATGEKVDRNNIRKRHHHHIYPDALLKEVEVQSYIALNCALINDDTNWDIGRKDPLSYLKDRYKWASEDIVNERLNSHLIPVKELANGGYEACTTDSERLEKVKRDFDAFIRKRAQYFAYAAKQLTDGKYVSSVEIINKNYDKANGT
ncbi:MAG TPA: DUF262 domain-containing protein [Smithellaceae bacterium]|jgi:hypothetical protein|nr:DUF262 domain-containing protein [Smithellaceae bacterium]HPL96593.1 DUF262 domain-containing protein [Smithellaceae bacterium]HQG96638.1 DUF262 domain-containing protein [Smithellaceae bacterium]HQK28265.1 DUF262 domain-containing protein [Smithellaceae bacterium]